MNFARGLLNDPWIFFLDEPTLGLDVAAARAVRELVLAWKAAVPGRTILLTTHYMAEVDELCERIAIVDHGRILAIGTPGRAQAAGPARVDLPARGRPAGRRAGRAGRRLPGVVRAAPAAASGPGAAPTARPSRSTSSSPTTAPWAASSARSAGCGSHIVALRKSEPSARGRLRRARRPRLRRGRRGRPTAAATTERAARRSDARPAEHGARDRASRTRRSRRMTHGAFVDRPSAEPAGGRRLDAAGRSCMTDLRTSSAGPTRASSGMAREPSWVFFEILLPFLDDVGVRLRLPRAPGAARVHRLRRARRGDDRVLAERRSG